MKYKSLMLYVLLMCLFSSCATASRSTGIIDLQAKKRKLPNGIPARVGVFPLRGDRGIDHQATDQFAMGLAVLGFDVMERQQIGKILSEINFQNSDYVDSETRVKLSRQFGLQGVFLGSITGESSIAWVDSHLNIRLVDVETGKVIWAAEAHDPRAVTLSMDPRTSVIYTVREGLRLLEKDIYGMVQLGSPIEVFVK